MKDKIKAFLVHLSISVFIACCMMVVVYGVWNPAPLHKATGITHIFLLILGIDIVLGPILTFIVYKKGKKTLVFDLIVIALIQASALIYGVYQAYEGRPVWIAYNVDRFDLIRANEIDIRKISEAKPEYQHTGIMGVKYVAALIPEDKEKAQTLMFDEIATGIAPSQRPELFSPIENAKSLIQKRALELVELNKYNEKNIVDEILAKYPKANSWVPLKANTMDMAVLLNKDTAEVIAIVDLRPWNTQ